MRYEKVTTPNTRYSKWLSGLVIKSIFGIFCVISAILFFEYDGNTKSELQENVAQAQSQAMELVCETPVNVYQEYIQNKKMRHQESELVKAELERRNQKIRSQYPKVNQCFDWRR